VARNGRFTTSARRWAIACVVALAVSTVLGATHIHVAHATHAAALPGGEGPDGPFVGRDCPACALAHVPAIDSDPPATIAPRDDAVGGVVETIVPRSSHARKLRPSRGPPPTR